MSKKIQVGLIFGGRSGEHEVSIASALSVFNALDKARYDVTLIAIDKSGRWMLPDVKALLAAGDNPLKIKLNEVSSGDHAVVPHPGEHQLVPVGKSAQGTLPKLDIVLPILHGTYGEDGTIQGLLEVAQIPYIGSGVLGSVLGMDKEMAGKLFHLAGIATVPTVCVRRHEFEASPNECESKIASAFGFPVFIKPANAGSSVGVHKVKRKEDLSAALKDAFLFDFKILVQKAIDARELEVSVLGNENPKASIVGEIVPRHEFYSYEAKYLDDNGADLHIPAKNLAPSLVEQAQAWAVRAFQALECRGMARVDFFLDRHSNQLYINEINTIPGFTRISMYPKLWEASGVGYAQLLDELIRLAIDHHQQKAALKTSYDPEHIGQR